MVEIKQCVGTNIYVFKNILSQEQCDYFVKEFSGITELQTIKEMPEISNKLWSFIGSKISTVEFNDRRRGKNFHITSLKPDITISKARFALRKHIDKKLGDDYFKLFFYLNKVSSGGGTDFYENEGASKVSVNNDMGSGALFDISLEHGSQPFPIGEMKYVMGVRPAIKYIT